MKNKKRALAAGGGLLLLLIAGGAFLVRDAAERPGRSWASWTVSDTLQILDASETPVVATAIVGDRSLETNCRVFTGSSEYPIGNLNDDSVLAVVSPTTAVYFGALGLWSWRPYEHRQIRLKPLIPLPVKIWRLSAVTKTAASDARNAAKRLREEWSGFDMQYTIEDVTALNETTASCNSMSQLSRTVDPRDNARTIFDPQALNVYYAESCGKDCIEAGHSCDADRRIGFVYPTGSEGTLLHELGHALLGARGIKHWAVSTGPMNVMRDSSAPGRYQFSTGQTIGMHYETSSVLMKLGLTSSHINCQQDCPSVEFEEDNECHPPEAAAFTLTAVEALFDCVECDDGQLNRVVTEARTNPGIVTTLGNTLAIAAPRPLGPEPAPPAPPENPYDANTRARQQRRAVKALELIALTNAVPQAQQARTYISNAAVSLAGYRTDVRRAINDSYVVIR
jgi:hypothetical protein